MVNDIFAGRPSFFGRRRPLFKLPVAAVLLAVFLLVPDRSLSVVIAKFVGLIALGLAASGFSHPKNWGRVLLYLVGFLGTLICLTALGGWLTGRGEFRYFKDLALKCFWVTNISYLLAASFHYRELVYLAARLKVPAAISSQVLLIFLVWGKFFEEFRRAPLAWKSRGLTSRSLRRRRGLILKLLKVVFHRTVRRAHRLEQPLLSRGFDGRLFTFWEPDSKNSNTQAPNSK